MNLYWKGLNVTLKQCTCCKKQLTTKNTTLIGPSQLGYVWFNCNDCNSTIMLKRSYFREKLFKSEGFINYILRKVG